MKMWMAAAAILTVTTVGQGAEAQVITPRGDGTYQRHDLPGTRSGDRLRVDPIPGTSSGVIRDSQGRRQGTVEQRSYGGYGVYDRQGRPAPRR
jgi:hypothetical protein